MRLDIRYRMVFAYDNPVWEAQNEIRVRPRDDARQRVIAYRLTPSPSARVMSFVDYWGTTVDHVGVREPHLSFELIAEAAVETSEADDVGSDPPYQAVHDAAFIADSAEYLARSPHVEWSDDLEAAARDVVDESSVAGTVSNVVEHVNDLLEYRKGTTSIGISLTELVEGGSGVCQDYAHLTIGMLRSCGVPARYVSGYLFAADETAVDEAAQEPVRVQTHAWVEALIPGHGWHPVDPTNRRPVGVRHVVIGHGRDYDDVAPVRGTYLGSATPSVDAEVEIRRMEAAHMAILNERPRRLNADQLEAHRRAAQQQQQQ